MRGSAGGRRRVLRASHLHVEQLGDADVDVAAAHRHAQ